jgi:hypothetical protein
VCMCFCAHLYVSNLPAAMNSQARTIIFATVHSELMYFLNLTNDIFAKLNKQFKANKLALNSDEETCIKCYAKNKTCRF